MKLRILPLTLALGLALALPAGAFSDVPQEAWYAGSVALCVESGLMRGTGPDAFSPGAGVSQAEVMTVAARLHYRTHGGEGDFPAAPESWGAGSLSTPTGAVLLSFDTREEDRDLAYSYDTESPRRLHLTLSVTQAERSALTPAGGRAEAVLTLNGVEVLRGSLAPAGDGSLRVEFVAGPGSDYTAFNRELSSFLPAPATGLWYRNALWYARENGLLDQQPMETPFEAPATRLDLAEWLYSALPAESLPALDPEAAPPDCREESVLALYRAGVLTGVDETGAFAAGQPLTRAELAAVLARVLDPSLRAAPAPADPSQPREAAGPAR